MGGGSNEMTPTGQTSNKSKSTTTSTPNAPTWASDAFKNSIQSGQQRIDDFANMSIDAQRVAPLTEWEQQGSNALGNFGQNENFLTGIGGLRDTAGGDYLYGGPAQQAFIDANMRMAQPGIFSAWGSANRTGGQLGKLQLGKVAADAYAGLYNNERNRQQDAQGQIIEAGQIPGQLQLGVGALERGITDAGNAAEYQAQMARLAQAQQAATLQGQNNQMIPSINNMFGTTVSSQGSGSGGTSQLVNTPGTGQNILGGALAGAGTGSAFGPWGAGIGAVGGGILGATQ